MTVYRRYISNGSEEVRASSGAVPMTRRGGIPTFGGSARRVLTGARSVGLRVGAYQFVFLGVVFDHSSKSEHQIGIKSR